MPKPLTFRPEAEWFIGEPDLTVTTTNDFVMYPKGPDWWIDQFGEVTLTEDRWIKAMEIAEQPEDRASRGRLCHRARRTGRHAGNRRSRSTELRGREATATSSARTPGGC